jgi:predicted RNase H-like nuclease (RuvC/YqgF family)
MARVHDVTRAQKDQGNCAGCGKPIKKGQPYAWVKASRFAMKFKRHPQCKPFLMTETEGNDKKAMCYQAQQDLQEGIARLDRFPDDDKRPDNEKAKEVMDDLRTMFDEAAGQVEEARSAWEESYDNLPEGFQQGDTGMQIEELKDQAEAYKDRLEEFPDEVEEWNYEEEDFKDWLESVKEEADQAAGELEF